MPPLFRALRPHQWVKNLFVGAPLLFSKNLFDAALAGRAAAAVALFCLVSSSVYLLNDVLDLDADRAHPKKRGRAIASGALSVADARLAAALFIVGALSAGAALGAPFVATLGGYLVLNLAYSLALKHMPFIDVLCIAGGFLLRVRGGAFAIDVPASSFLLLCTGLLAAFLGYGKRAHELRAAGARAGEQRRVLGRYRERPLWIALWALGVATVAAYAAYTRASHTLAYFGTGALVYTAPLVALGVARFLWLVARRPDAESPTAEMLRDRWFVATLALWIVAVSVVIYAR